MVIQFCPKCGVPLHRKKMEIGKAGCKKCGFTTESEVFKINQEIVKEKRGEGVGSDENELATYNNICKKCGHDKAQVIDMGVFISDEDYLILLRCGKCGNTERVGKRAT